MDEKNTPVEPGIISEKDFPDAMKEAKSGETVCCSTATQVFISPEFGDTGEVTNTVEHCAVGHLPHPAESDGKAGEFCARKQ